MPENSIAAFKKAIALGVTTLELDIQATKDRFLVVHHDSRLNAKLCVYDDGREVPEKLIKDLRYEDLGKIDCGRSRNPRFHSQQRVPGSRIPSLEEVLALARDAHYPVRVSIEIKLHKQKDGMTVHEIAEHLVGLVTRYDLKGRAIVQSFHPPALLALRDLDPVIPRAILVRKRWRYERLVRESGATILSPRYDRLREQDVKRFHKKNVAVIPWTVNKPADICRFVRWGVDGIISDYPDRVIKLYNSKSCYVD